MLNSLSIILPLYNEEKRLNETFKKIIKFSKKDKIKFKEFIFVDDGSSDNSYEIVKKFIKENSKLKNSRLKLIRLQKNLGKGAALKEGVKASSGKWILTSDIDFSVSLFELKKWEKNNYLKSFYEVYFGSRAHESSNVNQKFHRKIVGNFLRFLIKFFLNINIRDTQCGFKLYKRAVAKKLFSKIKFLGYEHDIEIVLLLKRNNIKIVVLPVTWKHVSHSKVNLIQDSCKFLIKIFFMKITY